MRPLHVLRVLLEHAPPALDLSNSPSYRPTRRHLKTIPLIHYHPLSLADQCTSEGPSPNTLRIHTIHSRDLLPPQHRTPTAPEIRRHRHMAIPTKDGLILQRGRLLPNIMPLPLLRRRPLTPSSSLFLARSNEPAASVRHLRHSVRNPPSHRDLDPTSVSSINTSCTRIRFTLTKRNLFSWPSLAIMSSSYPEASGGFIKSMRRSRRDRALQLRSTSRG